MGLFDNAIGSIDVGVADIRTSEHSRTISGLRNIYAGILLLIKEILRLSSPPDSDEVLIKLEILPYKDNNGKLFFKGRGKKTVDTQTMQKRCKSLEIKIDWKMIEEIKKHRNNAEHYYIEPNVDIRSPLDKSRIVIHDILRHLGKNPPDVLKTETWQYFLSESDIYEREKERCNELLSQINWESNVLAMSVKKAECKYCGSKLLIPEQGENDFDTSDMAYLRLKCSYCQKSLELHDVVEEIFHDLNPIREWKCKDDIDYSEDIIIQCPFCYKFSYSMEEKKCMFCQEIAKHKCQRCGIQIPASEISDGDFCGYCQHMLDKSVNE